MTISFDSLASARSAADILNAIEDTASYSDFLAEVESSFEGESYDAPEVDWSAGW